ncbi:phosphoribosylanthranilate isomerase [Candidatus Omnitrophota bacterium]
MNCPLQILCVFMGIKIKICGITRAEDALYAEELGASAVGFIFYPPSPRSITPADAGVLSKALGPFIARVGVFVDESPEIVNDTIISAGLTAVQLHGAESPEYIRKIRGAKVIKAFRVGTDFDPEELGRYSVTAFLLDTFDKSGYGGTGKTFDWNRAVPCKRYGKIILAGGLDGDNITSAVREVKPWGVDISSGVERKPGEKDHGKMKQFFDAIKRECDE